ncbi:MAG: S8 family serine peptidase, partial [Acidimicrobiales bacterium]
MPDHLDLPAPLRSPTRRARGGSGSLPVRSSHRAHGEGLAQSLQAIPVRPAEVDSIDPDLVFKFSAATRLPDGALETQGIEVLGEDEDWTYFVLLDDHAHQRFAEALSAYAATDDGRARDMTAALSNAIQTIDGIEPYGPEDRLAPDLDEVIGTGTIEVHVRLWPASSEEQGAERVARAAQLVSATAGCRVLASTSRPQVAAIVAEVTENGLASLSELSVVEKITPPIRIPVTTSQIEQAGIHDIPSPRGAPIGVLDDGPSTTNPLMAGVLAGSASFPDPTKYTWNPPGPHGTAVASLAAFYDFEEHLSAGSSLRTPHPIVAARVMEPRRGRLQTGQPYGTVFHESIEDAIRWVNSQGVRIVNLSINRNIAAPTGGPR